jgi:cell division transport system permease protein
MSLQYVIREGFSGFRRAKLSAVGSIVTIMTSLLLLGVFVVAFVQTGALVEGVRARVEMEVFLKEPISADRIAYLREQIAGQPGIERADFVSKDDAARIFKEEFGEDITKVLDFNPLPPSFILFLSEAYRNSDSTASLQGTIRTFPYVDDVIVRSDVLKFIEERVATAKMVGLTIGIFLAISAIFLVANTIRLAIAAKRQSIRTMHLVGATWWFVRGPFMVEGILQGLIGGLLAAGILYWLLSFAAGFFSADLSQFVKIDLRFFLFVVLGGITLGLLGSLISVKRFISEA